MQPFYQITELNQDELLSLREKALTIASINSNLEQAPLILNFLLNGTFNTNPNTDPKTYFENFNPD